MNTPQIHMKPTHSLSLANFTGDIVFATGHSDCIPPECNERRWYVVGLDVTAPGAEVTP